MTSSAGSVTLQAGPLKLVADAGRVTCGAAVAHPPPRVLRMVEVAMRAVGRIVTSTELMTACGMSAGAYANEMQRLRDLGRELETDALVTVTHGLRVAGHGVRRVAGLELDGIAEARMNGRPLPELGPEWLALLERLTRAPGLPVSKAELSACWRDSDGQPTSIDAAMAELCRLLGPSPESTLIVPTDDGYRIPIEDFGLFAVGALVFDPGARCTRLDTREQPHTPKECVLLEAFMRHAGEDLRPWWLQKQGAFRTPSSLSSCLSPLRSKVSRLCGVPAEPGLISRRRNRGYRLAVEQLGHDRRRPAVPEEDEWPVRVGDLRFKPDTRDIGGPAGIRTLGSQTATMLDHLTRAGGGVVDDAALCQAIWGGPAPYRVALDAVRRRLQAALDTVGSGRVVRRAERRGYRLA